MPTDTKVIYNVRNGKLDIDMNIGTFPALGVEIKPFDFINGDTSLRDIALKMTSGNLAVSVTQVYADEYSATIQITYTINMNNITLADGSTVELSMSLEQTYTKNRPSSPQEDEAKAWSVFDQLAKDFEDEHVIDPSALGILFNETTIATTMTIGSIIFMVLVGLFAFA